MEAIEKNKTWVLTEFPQGWKVISLKWVYKLKKYTNGEIIKYKQRIVTKGFVQEKGINFQEIFTPVTRLETIRLLFALSSKNGWEVHHLDVKLAFHNGELFEEVCVIQLDEFVKEK